jgi:predicted transposase YbfD/YdcC
MDHFDDLPDPRIERTKKHPLINILFIAVCAVICQADDFVEIADFGDARRDWLAEYLDLSNGIPSHDTFTRVFASLDPTAFGERFVSWMQTLHKITGGRIISIDGKTLRGSVDSFTGSDAIHMVSAWTSLNGLVLGQVKVDSKSNEITAIPVLLEMLDITDSIITIDAMGTQRAIAHQIISKDADYVLALKGNQSSLEADICALFERYEQEHWRDAQDQPVPYTHFQSIEKDHGRIETRTCWATQCPQYITTEHNWSGLRSMAVVQSRRQIGTKTTTERRYFISSLSPEASKIAKAVRAHWGIENSLHWVLDMAFNEDRARARKDHSPNNLATLRHIALNLIKTETTQKISVKRKRLRAALDSRYLHKIIFQTQETNYMRLPW